MAKDGSQGGNVSIYYTEGTNSFLKSTVYFAELSSWQTCKLKDQRSQDAFHFWWSLLIKIELVNIRVSLHQFSSLLVLSHISIS